MLTVKPTKLPQADRGYIYFADVTIDGEPFTKVGYSRDPNRRFTYDLSEFEHNEVHIEFKNVIPMMNWMYDHAEYTPDATYWELMLHNVMRTAGVQYLPEDQFSGYTECYRLTPREYKAAIDYLEEQLSMMAPPLGWCIPYSMD